MTDPKTRRIREEMAQVYDRLTWLAEEVGASMPSQDLSSSLARQFAGRLQAASDAVGQALAAYDREVLARDAPTAFCPYCRMTAEWERDETGHLWRVCRYCGAADSLATTNVEAGLDVLVRQRTEGGGD